MNNLPPLPVTTLTPAQVVDAFWHNKASNLSTGAHCDIEMDLRWKGVIGQDGVDEMARRYQTFIEAPIVVTEDESLNQLNFAPTFNPLGHDQNVTQTRVNHKKGKVQKIARPPNAFILFRKHYHNAIKDAEPGIHNNQISTKLGKAWNKASIEEKTHFRELAELEKLKHRQDHPDYVYQPRKPSEKKKRMTRRKREALKTDMSLPKTEWGSIVLEFGKNNGDVKNLRAKLEKHNRELKPRSSILNQTIHLLAPASIYTERTQDYQMQRNFYTEAMGGCIDPQLISQPPALVEDVIEATPTHSEQEEKFDKDQESNFDAELVRMDAWS